MKSDIADLQDYAALKKLAAALWQQDNAYNGAAIMVGAGFSRVAASTGDSESKLPLWGELSEALIKELGPTRVTDPLRLAEEYCAYFGRQALLDLLKTAINDSAWIPGILHKNLLELPWSEVLTTNWDSLLERASLEIHHPVYNIVNKQEDLSSARSPRIVKLHGTMNITNELVFTQEDYRKYPQQHAAFVNFARQAFIENELCLLGFSGDDPNFLQWAGWVRDHLATHARRIYLVGALNLSAAKRKYLESINVAPIDLSALVADYDDPDARHSTATKIFIEALQDLKPKKLWEWEPTKRPAGEGVPANRDPSYAAKLLEELLPYLEKDRKSYPGWLICPDYQRWLLRRLIENPWLNQNNLSAMTADCRAKLLYEIAWRHAVTCEVIQPWMAQELLTICDPAKSCALSKKQQMQVALLLLKNTRWLDSSEAQPIIEATTTILEQNERYWPESANELAYHHAIIARDTFDYAAVEKAVDRISADDPIWKIRKASLLAELKLFDEGTTLVAEAYRELLGQYRENRNSVYVLSRLTWAHWLMRGIDLWTPGKELEELPFSYQEYKCNPWDYIQKLKDEVAEALEKQRGHQSIEPMFEPGHYKDNANTIAFNSKLHPLLYFEDISVTAGIPLRWKTLSFLIESGSRLAALDTVDGMHRFALAIRTANSDSDDVLKTTFSRTQIARLTQEEVHYLMSRCDMAIDYWNSRLVKGNDHSRLDAIERLRVFIEVLARISVRATPEQSMQIFKKAITLGKQSEFHHFWWLFDGLRHLIGYALNSIPKTQQHSLLLDALSFPLQTEIEDRGAPAQWPNPIVDLPGNRVANAALDNRINEIIDQISPCSSRSAPALLRLIPLLEQGFLTDVERKKIGEKIWGADPDYQTLPETGLIMHALFTLPAPDDTAAKCAVRRHLYDASNDRLFDPDLLMAIAYAAETKGIGEFPLAEQALDYFRRLIAWRPKKDGKDPLGLFAHQERQVCSLIGQALAYSIVPVMPAKAVNQENFKLLLSFYSEVNAPASIIALSRFAAANNLFAEQAEERIRQGLHSLDSDKAACSAIAILKWRDLQESPATSRLISRLVYLLGSNMVSGLQTLLSTAREMYAKGYLSERDVEALEETIPVVFDGTDYEHITPSSRESVSISLVRAECVRLARDIRNAGQDKNDKLIRILEEAKQDALPEVRFAEETDD